MPFRSIAYILIACGCFLHCSDQGGKISVSLDTNSIPNAGTIQRFVLIATSDQSVSLLFPDECVKCINNQSECEPKDRCFVKEPCGYLSSTKDILADLSFTQYAKDSVVTVLLCAIDGAPSFIASAQGTVNNTNGATLALSLTADTVFCTGSVPPECP